MKAFETETVFEQTGGIALMGRGLSVSTGEYFQQADFETINLKIFDMADPGTPVNGDDGEDLVIADVIFNTLQTSDDRWDLDSTGFNFLYETKATDLPSGGRKFRFEFEFTPADDATDPFFGVFEVPTLSLYRA
jgi:hypothetical protein